MRNKDRFITIFLAGTLLASSLTGCAQTKNEPQPTEVTQVQETEQEVEKTYTYSNSVGNIYNNGLFFSDEENNLYVYSSYAPSSFRVNSADDTITYFTDASLYNMNKIGDNIYGVKFKYSEDGEGGELVAYSLTDNTCTTIYDDIVRWPQAVNQMLYFTDETNNYLRCYDTETKEVTVLLEEAVYYPVVQGDVVYFQKDSDNESLYSMSLTDGTMTKLNSSRSYFPLIYNDKIYYSSADENNVHSFRSMNLDGSEDTHLADIFIMTANIYNDTYYFLDANNPDVISYIDLTADTIEVKTLDLQEKVKEKFLEAWGNIFTYDLTLTNYNSYNFADNKMLFYVEVMDKYIFLGGEAFLYDFETGEVELVCEKYDLLEDKEEQKEETTQEPAESDTADVQPQEPEVTTTVNYPNGDYSVGSIYGPKLSQQELNEVAEKVNQFLATYNTASMSDYQKVTTAHDYLCQNVSYAASWANNDANTAWGALVYGEAQCSGYARAMKALCDAMGVGCYYVHADENAINPSHQWNEVCVDGNWYIIDVQCNDDSGFPAFFLVSDTTYANAGLSWDRSSVPACPNDY